MESTGKSMENIIKWIVVAILCFVIVMVIFVTGVFVGQEKARYSFVWAENYHRNFGGPIQGPFSNMDMQQPGFSSVHGIFGVVIKVDKYNVIVKGQDNMEKMVTASSDTIIVDQNVQIPFSDIKMGNNVVVVGEPDEHGWIGAKLIRVFP